MKLKRYMTKITKTNIKFYKIIIILINTFIINIYEIIFLIINNNKHNILKNNQTNNYIRFLLDGPANFDVSTRTNNEDLISIENCQNSDDKYFNQYVSGNYINFNKTIDNNRAVRNNI